ncbi:MAG: hypothetical protein PHU14_02750 [Methylovulum sp.]|nr:hypothetical protein [Methylovulum sp.]
MKACETCTRVEIGKNHNQMPVWKRAVGMVLVYLPILTLPFVILSAYKTYYHLLFVGATKLKKWSDFIPDRASHRYTLKNQITMKPSFFGSLSQYKLFWILNCTWYCPYSVALFEWHAYMVKIVENWWCPFGHDKKHTYDNAPIDKSFWHIYPHDNAKLTDEDRDNPIWNDGSES